ncbi:DNA-binding GntR family transcriptional regulator [Kineococcus xinjiangensis]|uniref:DNA-binding GntR family transcriptional regulator n=1 Tax=Kineococcus xinjiangensis TaxID=512762 RepID=A0A2S6IVM0_9ACTN|nr:GntR family transcriptional regulator [Kineococcus xinjiangensis]PPK98409.1 DNA-binding GntR family transcriptional regulator [Kineococcus xinjiangensis]
MSRSASPSVREPGAPPAAERVYAAVKAAILDRSLPGGELLTEGDIAERVGVSRTPVREGLLRLEAEGLLKLIPKRGALVVPVSPEEVEDVLEARELVETHAAAVAWPRRDQLAPVLADHLAAMHAAAQDGDTWAFMGADRAFHAAVVAAAGNAVLTRFYDSLRDRQMRMGVTRMEDEPERMTIALREHTTLLQAARSGDEDTWRGLTREHLRGAGDRLRGAR